MEIWKIIVLVVTGINYVYLYGNARKSWSDLKSTITILLTLYSIAIIAEQVNWDFLFKKI